MDSLCAFINKNTLSMQELPLKSPLIVIDTKYGI